MQIDRKIDRKTPPPFVLPEKLSLPAEQMFELGNGAKLWTLKAGTQDVIRLTLVFDAGTRRQAHPFVASSMLNMLSEGTEKYTAGQVSERLDFYGIYYDTSIDRDYAMITVSCLNRFLPETLELLEEIVVRPAFLPGELDIYRTKRKQQLKVEREKPAYIARELFAEALFGPEHPYGIVSSEDDYDGVTVEMLRDYHREFFGADNMFAVASGMLGDDQQAAVREMLSAIGKRNAPADSVTAKPVTLPFMFRERGDAMQSSIRIGKLLFPKGHPDFGGMQVLAMVLGGYFGSRLVDNLREEHGYTYGVYSAMLNMKYEGYIAIATDVAGEHTADAVDEIFAEIERLRTEIIPDQELDMVRNIIVGEMMRILDGPFGIADVTIENIQNGDDNDALNKFLDQVRCITPARLQELAVRYLDPATFTTVVVGGEGMKQWLVRNNLG